MSWISPFLYVCEYFGVSFSNVWYRSETSANGSRSVYDCLQLTFLPEAGLQAVVLGLCSFHVCRSSAGFGRARYAVLPQLETEAVQSLPGPLGLLYKYWRSWLIGRERIIEMCDRLLFLFRTLNTDRNVCTWLVCFCIKRKRRLFINVSYDTFLFAWTSVFACGLPVKQAKWGGSNLAKSNPARTWVNQDPTSLTVAQPRVRTRLV